MLAWGNPLPALCVSIVGALVGLFLGVYAAHRQLFLLPWGYFVPLSSYGGRRLRQGDAHGPVRHAALQLGAAGVHRGAGGSAVCSGLAHDARQGGITNAETLYCCGKPQLHASPIWAMFVVLPLISAGYGTFNYLQNLEILTERWYSLWTQHTLFYSMLFFPAMVSAYAAYLWRLEHMGHNWNLIMAVPVRPFDLFLAKFLVVVKLMCFTQVFVYILYLVCGRLFAGFYRLAACLHVILLCCAAFWAGWPWRRRSLCWQC